MRHRSLFFALLFLLPSAVTLRPLLAADTEAPASKSEELASYEKKITSYQEDLSDIGKGLAGLDQEIAIALIGRAGRTSLQITNIQDLLLIDSQVHDEADKRAIKAVASARMKAVADSIDFSIRGVNNDLTYVKNPAVVATANKFKDDLRGLKELLLTF
jgi:hypothetical protein